MRLGQGPSREEMERLRRLQALQPSQKPAKSNRKRIEAKVLHVHRPELDEMVNERKRKEEEERLRKQMKAEALRRRQEEEEEQAKMEAMKQQEKLQKKYEKQIYSDKVEEDQEDYEDDDEEDFVEPLLKPVFVPKDSRQTVLDEEVLAEEEARAQEERQKEAHSLLAEHVRITAIAKAKKKAEELEATSGAFDPRSVEDTDDVDAEAELEAWKLRELLRIKRDREEREAREREQIELERIRNLTESERQELDKQKAAEWEASKSQKSDYKFLQKYYHKGAFFGDLESSESVVKRDYAQPTGEDRANRALLPEVMQVRNFGKRGRTKWTHLTAEDTTNFVDGWGAKKNETLYRSVGRMGGMKGGLERPAAKRPK